MNADLIRVGNSQGIRIPKSIIQQCGFEGRVHLEVKENNIILSPVKGAREGWEKTFQNTKKDSCEPFEYIESEWDKTEWQW